jgi:ribosomal protein S27AE
LANLTPEQIKKIQDKLVEKNALRDCPRCGNKNFTLIDGYFLSVIQDQTKQIKLDGNGLPTIVIVCNNCGFVSQHALGALGFVTSSGEFKVE